MTSSKRVHNSQDDRPANRRPRLNEEHDREAVADVEFEVLQGYRKFAEAVAEDRAKMARTGDIDIALKNLDTVDTLFAQVAGTKNNGLFAHDARAMLSISELAQISVRNLKFDNHKTLVNLDDVLNSLKKFMLKEYFDLNGISEGVLAREISDEVNEEEQGEVETEDDEGTQGDAFKERELRKAHLQHFSSYNQFEQFNWFKLGGLYNNLSKNVLTVDHMLGPFSVQKKVRAPAVRREHDVVGAVTTADRVTQRSLSSEQVTTPEQVKKLFKILARKKGKEQINMFKFVINPNSFSKTVENLFYVSFLIKEGRIVLEEDPDGFPGIRIKEALPTDPRAKEIESQQRREAHQNHIIFQIDVPTWKKLIERFEIRTAFVE
ncbi:related to NSE4-Nuclear protein that plays a role in the function of the Smc5p-Rhc18p DNA repair complex [Zygosaccharomyces bailii ISA1307]|uniref:Non-structural maintenance of chromosomes element 4 n=1 Tax=Zygosaccharomyces bailii (strain CLIB 213 / ATCC 58445 / CBS 680 / BCRC 21525 / NBRC 1098 / NCYC 1416 / NRRL Y-2227) TaxID=1333698 RepID=A0A8J2T3M6_ZYGB2|nr:BN860_03708g1_1 [Zygosaccharomyces bailii CLIB 213]CDH15614.1 related to NSE4-Nuclear protein that plays a role in the function of the Smc5p-Rhc18p DNA repair complex [Zygosaccharomyces bailii ISA1307]